MMIQLNFFSYLFLAIFYFFAPLSLHSQYPHPHKNQREIYENKAREKMARYVIPNEHPMKARLDAIFKKNRVTCNEKTFKAAGFVIKGEQRPRSFMLVASHPHLRGYLVKVYLDTERRKKEGRSSWKWLLQRCMGAERIRKIINAKEFKYFTVARKWIYPLPAKPEPPKDSHHTKHLALLLVSDMKLVPKEHNYYAWYHYITKDHLDELYAIITYAGGASYRPDNISYTRNGTFAFIDTEYLTSKPDYKSIRRYLNREMLHYWDKLVKKGGR